jgi:hypothetical protein
MKTCIVAIALLTGLPASAAENAASADRALACSDIKDAAARLECFDRSAAAAREPVATAMPVAPPAQPATPQAAGKPAEQLPLHARIIETRKASGGLYLVILDNGQTWRHESGSMEPYLKVGEAVTIRKGSLGSHRLTLDSGKAKNWVRVTRVR